MLLSSDGVPSWLFALSYGVRIGQCILLPVSSYVTEYESVCIYILMKCTLKIHNFKLITKYQVFS